MQKKTRIDLIFIQVKLSLWKSINKSAFLSNSCSAKLKISEIQKSNIGLKVDFALSFGSLYAINVSIVDRVITTSSGLPLTVSFQLQISWNFLISYRQFFFLNLHINKSFITWNTESFFNSEGINFMWKL